MSQGNPMPAVPAEETTIFELRPAGRAFAGLIVLGLALVPLLGLGLLILLHVGYRTAATRYRLTTQRLFVQTGLVAKRLEEVELFRVKDVTLEQGFFDRLLGVGQVTVLSTDDSAPRVTLAGIPEPEPVKEQIRTAFRAARRREGLRTGEFIPS